MFNRVDLGGVARFARKHGIPVWLTHGTSRLLSERALPQVLIHYVDPHECFSVGDIMVTPYTVPHDAYEPVQYVFSDGAYRLGVLTDVGVTTPHIEASFVNCDALVLEANHDIDMLRAGPYPASLKQRVSGRFGHLDNQTAAELLARLKTPKLQHVLAAHLSKQTRASQIHHPVAQCRSNHLHNQAPQQKLGVLTLRYYFVWINVQPARAAILGF